MPSSTTSVPLAATDAVVAGLVETQLTCGEGPCIDAVADGHLHCEVDLAAQRSGRWMAFAPAALDLGARTVCAVPIAVGVARIGSLLLYRTTPGPLSDVGHTDAVAAGGLAASAILGAQSSDGDGVETGAQGSWAVLHQAAGMVSVQLGVSVGEALVRMRSHAFATNRSLRLLAGDVVSRALRFDDAA
ncbi:MAG: hypothetical protein WKF43_13970 [Acidimicrobiales bacterium]